jgi:transcriptional regulator with XRE-family HTH domain
MYISSVDVFIFWILELHAAQAYTIIDKHIGARVRMRRQMLHMSRKQLADAVQPTPRQVQAYERGINRIGAGLLQQIADVLRVPMEFFFEGLPTSRGRPRKREEHFSTAEEVALNEAFTRIKQPALQRIILKLVERIGRSDSTAHRSVKAASRARSKSPFLK